MITSRKKTINIRLHAGFIITNLLIIILQALVINYLYHLDNNNCKCAMDYRRTYIIVFLAVVLLESVIMIIPPMYRCILRHVNAYHIIRAVMFAAFIINIVFVFQYIKLLKDKKCECSESVYRTILYVENIIDISGICMIGVAAVHLYIHALKHGLHIK